MELLLIGRIWRAHGIRGELKVIPETDAPERFDELDVVYVGKGPDGTEPRRIEGVRLQHAKRGLTVVLRLEGVASREEADALRQYNVYADEADLPPLAADEIYLHDLVGLEVVTEEGEPVGTVGDVLQMPAHDVYLVHREGREDAMIPAVPEFVLDVDLEARRLVVRPIEGLLE